LLRPALPRWPVQCPNDQVIVANNLWLLLAEIACQKMFCIVLMSNEQITARAVAARLVQRQYKHRIHMDHQWQLPLQRLAVTLWAPRKPHVLIRIEKEALTRGLFAQLCHSFLFPLCHYLRYSSFLDLCHRCYLRSISLLSYQNRYTFTNHVSWPPQDFHWVRVFTAARGARSRHISNHMVKQLLCGSKEIVIGPVCHRLFRGGEHRPLAH
jgi:hypothetical protein